MNTNITSDINTLFADTIVTTVEGVIHGESEVIYDKGRQCQLAVINRGDVVTLMTDNGETRLQVGEVRQFGIITRLEAKLPASRDRRIDLVLVVSRNPISVIA